MSVLYVAIPVALALGMLAFMLTGACSFALALRLRRDGC